MPSSELSAVFSYVYYLYSRSHQQFYVGVTSDLRKRLGEHNRGLNFSTKPYVPWELIYYEAHLDQDDALRRESYLKTTQGRQALRRMLRNQLKKLGGLSRQKVYY